MPTTTQLTAPFRVLLVEDDPLHADLTTEALTRTSVPTTVAVAADGRAAIAHLRDEQTPPVATDLVLLDLRLPGLSGHEVLAEIKQDAMLRRIPVVVLTTSTLPDDVARAYDAGANAYVAKPGDFFGLADVAESICTFWGKTAQRPPT